MDNDNEISDIMKNYYERNGIQFPPTSCPDVLGRDIKPGNFVFIARSTPCRGNVLDYGEVVKIDVKKQKVLIDWKKSPNGYTEVYSKRGGGCDVYARRKSWIWNRLCGIDEGHFDSNL